ncbi:chemotaxis protein CheC [Halanaeroarchaeum sulfurireducens]|uniref:Chemotaxis protein CheC1 n=1 Tax=Halanaeroarchaeum sulfurireducens TaxID=1604004 RepID=A0A0F7PEU3_9EURY|nr:chemotaxis protein CheC [Halanaeroarchaeum sulfurireducens]AKH97848.1 chemotaxis protein CheC1 [Halanaeroarchaeum sulfurireducens]ALG82242.1 chemotaxis protein CheC1 [Halanaeroarchaeum sulfurireducens]
MSTKIDIRRLRDVNELAKAGAETVAEHLNQLTGVETEMRITKINVIDVEDLGRHLGETKMVGVNIPLKEPPHGSVLILFDDDSAKTLAHTMLGSESSAGSGYSEMERSAIREVGNIMTSGFIDGWANVLGRTIDISTPQLLRAGGDDIVDHCVNPGEKEIAMVFDSTLEAPDVDVEATIYTFPDIEEFVDLINSI